MHDRSLCWIRRDLRLTDHRALALAASQSKEVAIAFLFDRAILDPLSDRSDKRLAFIKRSLDEMDEALKAQGSRLLTLQGLPAEEIPRLAKEWGASVVYASHDDDPYALARDAQVKALLAEQGIALHTVKDCTVFERSEVTRDGIPYRVYTPYSKAWKARVTEEDIAESVPDLSRLAPESALPSSSVGVKSWEELGFRDSELWLEPGESGAQTRLAWFLERIHLYAEQRDIPSLDGTSGLSVHLRFGTLSIRQCFREGMAREGKGAEKWVNELIWRDFYHMILAQFPHVVEKPFQLHLQDLEWPGLPEHFTAWKEGKTGYPIVDAAMRCLAQTGWMHNRLRMITASFLAKDLLIDWRLGEAWFAEKLLDFDLASNNGGWQWSASTGVDAQPYFRVFNPLLQSRKFDPEGKFIREWCPELAEFPNELIHCPSEATGFEQLQAGCEIGKDYPLPLVDHQEQKAKAIALFKFPEQPS